MTRQFSLAALFGVVTAAAFVAWGWPSIVPLARRPFQYRMANYFRLIQFVGYFLLLSSGCCCLGPYSGGRVQPPASSFTKQSMTTEERATILSVITPEHGIANLDLKRFPPRVYVAPIFFAISADEKELALDAICRAAYGAKEGEPATTSQLIDIYDNRDRKRVGRYDRARGVRMD